MLLILLMTVCTASLFWTCQDVLTLEKKERFSISFNLLIQNFQSRGNSRREWPQEKVSSSNSKPGFQRCLVKFR